MRELRLGEPGQLLVSPAGSAVGRGGDVLVALGLSSGVAIALYDGTAQVGGLAHILLPSHTPGQSSSERGGAQVAVPKLLAAMEAEGAVRARIVGHLVGGATLFGPIAPVGLIRIGERNVIASRQTLHGAGVSIESEAIGGEHGRSVQLWCNTGRLVVSTVTMP